MSTDTASEALLAWEISTRENIVQNLADNPELLALVRTMPFGRSAVRPLVRSLSRGRCANRTKGT